MANDILLDSDYNFQIANGDFVVGESDAQDVELILVSERGEWKQSPLVGVGIRKFQNAPESALVRNKVKSTIKQQLENDGFKVNDIKLKSFEDVVIDCERPIVE